MGGFSSEGEEVRGAVPIGRADRDRAVMGPPASRALRAAAKRAQVKAVRIPTGCFARTRQVSIHERSAEHSQLTKRSDSGKGSIAAIGGSGGTVRRACDGRSC